jgi:hypothetical protein
MEIAAAVKGLTGVQEIRSSGAIKDDSGNVAANHPCYLLIS